MICFTMEYTHYLRGTVYLILLLSFISMSAKKLNAPFLTLFAINV